MIKYVGYFKDVEKDYIEKSIPIDSIIIRQDPYYPISSIDEVFEYIDLIRYVPGFKSPIASLAIPLLSAVT